MLFNYGRDNLRPPTTWPIFKPKRDTSSPSDSSGGMRFTLLFDR